MWLQYHTVVFLPPVPLCLGLNLGFLMVSPRNQFGLPKAKARIYQGAHRINVKAAEQKLKVRKEPEKIQLDRIGSMFKE